MADYFDICGTPIKISDIKDFRIVQREYIFRPSYKEVSEILVRKKQVNFFFTENEEYENTKYIFDGMSPYAAIYDESNFHFAVADHNPQGLKDAVAKDLMAGVFEKLGDKFQVKAFKEKKYRCINLAGRKFTTYLEEIPVQLTMKDGRLLDIDKDNDLFYMLGESVVPAIQIVDALYIKTDKNYLFYGNGIQVDDIFSEYERLKYEMSVSVEEKRELIGKVKNFLPKKPKIGLPVYKKREIEKEGSPKGFLDAPDSSEADKDSDFAD